MWWTVYLVLLHVWAAYALIWALSNTEFFSEARKEAREMKKIEAEYERRKRG